MIYTSYFANIDNLPKDAIKISIARYTPDWVKDKIRFRFDAFAPSPKLLSQIKNGEITKDEYDVQYLDMLNRAKFTPQTLRDAIDKMTNKTVDIVFLCYEAPGRHCHRHLFAKWFNNYFNEELIVEYGSRNSNIEAEG
jgi:uncharacterized protein YeaO (DUF488 family)